MDGCLRDGPRSLSFLCLEREVEPGGAVIEEHDSALLKQRRLGLSRPVDVMQVVGGLEVKGDNDVSLAWIGFTAEYDISKLLSFPCRVS